MKRLSSATAFLLLTAIAATAQSRTGSIVGFVHDAQDAAVAGATVSVANQQTNVVRTFITNVAGAYAVPFLDPGIYSVGVDVQGFKKTSRRGIILRVGDELRIDFTLEVGAVSEQITVEATAPLINTANSTLGQVIENRRMVDLPLNGREPFALSYLVPGVLPPPTASYVHLGGSVPSISGAANFTSEVTVDGMPNTTPRNISRQSFLIYTPSVDAVEEFRVHTNALSAEYGRFNGGLISVVTKTGTNSYHGTAYEFHRNSYMDANDFFNNRAGLPLGALRRNQFGLTLGGPVLIPRLFKGKDRTFLFVSYEGFREAQLANATYTVPTALERRGDFSQTVAANGRQIQVFDPLTLASGPAGQTRSAFPGNIVPEARISPISSKLAEFYPQPNSTRLVGNLNVSSSRNNVTDTADFRLDHNFSSRHKVFGRYSFQDPTVNEPNFFGNIAQPSGGPLVQGRKNVTLQDTYTLSPSLIVNLNYGIARMYGVRSNWNEGADATQYGFPAYYKAAQQLTGMPVVTIGSMSSLFDSYRIYSSQMNHSAMGSVSKVHGSHTMKMGADYRAYYINILQNSGARGSLGFGAGFTQGPNPNQASANAGFGMATFLLGIPTGSIGYVPALASRSAYTAAYFQDDWKATRRLTLNFGLRYELSLPRTERYDRISVFDQDATSPIASRVPGYNLRGVMNYRDENNRALTGADGNNFGPRFGFAYQLFPSTTLRGGYGIFYGISATDAAGAGSGFNDGFSVTTSIVSSLDGVTPISRIENPYPNGVRPPIQRSELGPLTLLGQAVSSSITSLATPYFQQWNFSIQQGIGSTLLLEAAYSANKGTHMDFGGLSLNSLTEEQNRLGTVNQQLLPNPFYGVITDPTSSLSLPTIRRSQLLLPYPHYTGVTARSPSIGNMIYHSLQAKVEKRMSRGFTLLASYTIGKNINDLSQDAVGPTSGNYDPYNIRLDRSIDPQDVSQRLVFSGVWEVPVGRGRLVGLEWNRAVDAVLGGWQINGIASFQKGLPLIAGSIGTARPDRIATGQKITGPHQQRLTRWFDTSAFAVPQAFHRGNMSRTAPDIRGPGINNFDLSLFKQFQILEGLRAQLRLESFNAFNRVKFSGPGTTTGSASFGVITSQDNTPRQMQVALKIIF